jgi:hypothetical protein
LFGTDKRLPKDNQINAKKKQKIYERGCEQVMKKKSYKMKKKDWLMLLDFWPLSIVTPAMLILILFGSALGWGG